MRIDYDEKADVLYVSIGDEPSLAIEIDDCLLLRYGLDSHKLMGYTLIGIQELIDKAGG